MSKFQFTTINVIFFAVREKTRKLEDLLVTLLLMNVIYDLK